MQVTRARERRREARGAVAVEFALVVLPLIYLVMGVITYGYLLTFRQSISQGAAEGARAAAVAPAGFTATQQQDAARSALNAAFSSYGISCTASGLVKDSVSVGTCTISVATCVNDASRRCVSVAIDYRYHDHPLVPLPGLGLVTPNDLGYTAVAEVSG